ncbi:MAG: hypothetical protein RR651_04800, partial [Lysinibacillus sp.]
DNEKNNLFMDTLSGELIFYGKNKLTKLSIESFFPNKRYSYARSDVRGQEAVGFFTRYKNEEKPLRMIISSATGRGLLNILVAIDNFNHGYDRVGDTPYTLDITEYIPPKISATVQKATTAIKPAPTAGTTRILHKLHSGAYRTQSDMKSAVNKLSALKVANKDYIKTYNKGPNEWYWETGTYTDKKVAANSRQKILSAKIAKIVHLLEVKI